jgi:hypothetical protein
MVVWVVAMSCAMSDAYESCWRTTLQCAQDARLRSLAGMLVMSVNVNDSMLLWA